MSGKAGQVIGESVGVLQERLHEVTGYHPRPQDLDRSVDLGIVEEIGSDGVQAQLVGRTRVGRTFGTALGGSREPVEVDARHRLGLGVDPLQEIAHVPLHRLGDGIDQELFEHLACGVVPRYGRQRGVPCHGDLIVGKANRFLSNPDGEVTSGGLMAAQQSGQGVGEAGAALHARRVERAHRVRGHSGQFPAGRQNDVVLSERGKDLGDVVEEPGVRAHHQNAFLSGARERVQDA